MRALSEIKEDLKVLNERLAYLECEYYQAPVDEDEVWICLDGYYKEYRRRVNEVKSQIECLNEEYTKTEAQLLKWGVLY